MEEAVDVALILLNYNSDSLCLRAIESINIQDFKRLTTVIVCNGENESFNNIKESIKNQKNISVIQTENKGYAHGNNTGIKHAISIFSPKFIVIMNPDCILTQVNTISTLVQLYGKYKSPGMITGLIRDGKKIKYQESFWTKPTIFSEIQFYIRPLSLLKRLNIVNLGFKNIYGITGAFFLIETSLMEQIGFFDEETFLYMEENILSEKISKLGRKNYISSEVMFLHEGASTINNSIDSKGKYKILLNSKLYYYSNYRGWKKLRLYIVKILHNLKMIELSILNLLK